MNSQNVISENADADISAHILVKFSATGVAIAGTTDAVCGTNLNDVLSGKAASVALRKAFGLHYVTVGSNTAIAAGDELDQAANGKVVKAAGGTKIGIAREPSTASGSQIRAYLYSSPTV